MEPKAKFVPSTPLPSQSALTILVYQVDFIFSGLLSACGRSELLRTEICLFVRLFPNNGGHWQKCKNLEISLVCVFMDMVWYRYLWYVPTFFLRILFTNLFDKFFWWISLDEFVWCIFLTNCFEIFFDEFGPFFWTNFFWMNFLDEFLGGMF